MLVTVSKDSTTEVLIPFISKLETDQDRQTLFSDRDFQTRLVEHIRYLHGKQPILGLTFDVFDTILLRTPKCEARRFWEIAERVAGTLKSYCERVPSQEDVFLARILATRASYRTRRAVEGCREGSLDAIYDGICQSLGASPDALANCVTEELAYEVEVTRENPLIEPLLDLADEIGASVAMLSDMYMHAHHIEVLLEHHFGQARGRLGPLFSSADLIVSKRSGKLFDRVCKELGRSGENMLHLGDNIIGDFQMPVLQGWRAILTAVSRTERNEIASDFDAFAEELARRNLVLDDWIKSGI